jgi:hypothetical protein
MTRPPNEVLAGLVERVTFHNAENGFCVLRIKARGHRDLVTVVGHAASISAGAWITASGGWTNDPVHGQQFRAAFLKTSAPSSAEYQAAMSVTHCSLVFNGDIGMIEDVDDEDGEVRVRFDGRPVAFGFGERDMLVPACAVTINKSQGSEYPAIVIPVMTQHYAILQRNLLGTGITRGKKLVVLTGQRKAIAIAVRNASGRSRWSKLREWLAGRDGH